jgi:hypothetical protein
MRAERKEKFKQRLLNALNEHPIISDVCKDMGFSRSTFYRWYSDELGFHDQVDLAIAKGRHNVNDLAERSLIKLIEKGDFKAIKFWLTYSHRSYIENKLPLRKPFIEPRIEGWIPVEREQFY